MKLIAVFMVILISFCPIVTSRDNAGRSVPERRLISEAAKAGRKQRPEVDERMTESVMEADGQGSSTLMETARPTEETIMVFSESENAQPAKETIPAPIHEHSWRPVKETIHHDAVYQTVHHDAVTEQAWIEDIPAFDEVRESRTFVGMHDICKGCGMDITASGMSLEEYEAHDRQHMLNGEDSSYFSQPVYETVSETIHHDAEGHYEEVVVQEAWDEEILILEAWDEDTTTGYICEECGEVK